MGISAAMTPKERKQILKGLLDQGATVHREGKRGTILHLKDGKHFNVPTGTSDYKARLAMRAEVKRAGYHWPLDPPEKAGKKASNVNQASDWLSHFMADRDTAPVAELKAARPATVSMNSLETAMRSLGFSKPDGFSGKWVFSMFPDTEVKDEDAGDPIDEQEPERDEEEKPETLLDMIGLSQEVIDSLPTSMPKSPPKIPYNPLPEVRTTTAEAEVGVSMDSDDAEIELAEEYERRAIKAERDYDGARVALEAERAKHAETRTNLMRRIAQIETRSIDREKEVQRLRSLLEERAAEDAEPDMPAGTTLARAHRAEQQVENLREQLEDALNERKAQREIRALQDDKEDLIARLRSAENAANEARNQLRAAAPVHDDWWPMEPQDGQSLNDLIRGAGSYGLEIRLQARRK